MRLFTGGVLYRSTYARRNWPPACRYMLNAQVTGHHQETMEHTLRETYSIEPVIQLRDVGELLGDEFQLFIYVSELPRGVRCIWNRDP